MTHNVVQRLSYILRSLYVRLFLTVSSHLQLKQTGICINVLIVVYIAGLYLASIDSLKTHDQ